MPFEFGDVVLAPFPFTDQVSFKKRPAVVVSSHAYNSVRPDVVIMPITSQVRPTFALGEVLVSEWQQANLLKPSAIKPVLQRSNNDSSFDGSAFCNRETSPHCAQRSHR